jgi:peptidoglycan/xylan/chitin deacetylase (PgdA/CDA1 family)
MAGTKFFLAINFHYIGVADRYPYKGIVGVTPAEFELQLDALADEVEFVSSIDIELAVRGVRGLPDRAAVITFDDGLKEQFVEALPILERRKIPFICFVNTAPLAENKPCFIHKLHYLRSIIHPEQFLLQVKAAAIKLNLLLPDPDQVMIPPMYYPYDEPGARSIKYLLNFFLPSNDSKRIVDDIFRNYCSESEFCRWFYLGKDDVKELHMRFSAIGSHGHSHCSLASLSPEEARIEIGRSTEILREMVGAPVSCISYPYGYRDSVSPGIAELAREHALLFGFTMEGCLNRDVTVQSLLLGRINNNEAPGYPQAAFNFHHGAPHINDSSRVGLHRTWFVDEKIFSKVAL